MLETRGPLLRRAWQGANPDPLAFDYHRVAVPTAIDIGAGIGGVMQDGDDPTEPERAPVEGPTRARHPTTPREGDMVLGKVAHDSIGTP